MGPASLQWWWWRGWWWCGWWWWWWWWDCQMGSASLRSGRRANRKRTAVKLSNKQTEYMLILITIIIMQMMLTITKMMLRITIMIYTNADAVFFMDIVPSFPAKYKVWSSTSSFSLKMTDWADLLDLLSHMSDWPSLTYSLICSVVGQTGIWLPLDVVAHVQLPVICHQTPVAHTTLHHHSAHIDGSCPCCWWWSSCTGWLASSSLWTDTNQVWPIVNLYSLVLKQTKKEQKPEHAPADISIFGNFLLIWQLVILYWFWQYTNSRNTLVSYSSCCNWKVKHINKSKRK